MNDVHPKNDARTEPFPMSRVFPTRADIYARNQGKDLGAYTMSAVHMRASSPDIYLDAFCRQVPMGAEAVVEFDMHHIGDGYNGGSRYFHVVGVALIPKNAPTIKNLDDSAVELPEESLEKTVAAMGDVKI